MQRHFSTLTVTPRGVMMDGMPLNKSTPRNLPPQTLREIAHIEELLKKVRKEDWDNPVLYAGGEYPALAKASMRAALLSPQPFPPPLNKAGFNPNEPRDERGRWTNDGATVTIHSNKNITIHHTDGSEDTRIDGSRSWRNNNPGNIISGTFADQHGAIGDNNGFAVFPDYETGQAASVALLSTSTYSDLTIDEAIARRSPPETNDTAQVQANVRSIGGFSGNEVIGDLSSEQLVNLVNAIKRAEGWAVGTVLNTPASHSAP